MSRNLVAQDLSGLSLYMKKGGKYHLKTTMDINGDEKFMLNFGRMGGKIITERIPEDVAREFINQNQDKIRKIYVSANADIIMYNTL